ncbi:hypothetical protein EZS27_037021 [termite gut metagenome]|uniref:DUF4943 domain-containing protein n=1 Tax=termite gut metagenome TaxID=433724 RepID=A0A5J4PQY8_9ZZZZ
MKKIILGLLTALAIVALGSCSEETLDYNNPDVKLFVKQLKAGTYNTKNPLGIVEVPLFDREDIPELLRYSGDLTKIASFPPPSISSYGGGEARLGECMLWIVETTRIGQFASLGCKLVYADADNYEGIYFLSDEEVLEVSALYQKWWEKVEAPPPYSSVNPYTADPLWNSNYRWW